MFRIYLEDKSFYDVSFDGNLGEFLQFGLMTSTNLSILETTSGEIAINRELIVKIIKL